MVLGILVSVLVPLGFMYAIWTLEIYAQSRMRVLFGAVLWGVIVFEIARLIHAALRQSAGLTFDQIALAVAPVIEESLKALLIIWLASRMKLSYAVDGTAYGFAIGTGFAMAENLHYLGGNPDRALGIALARVLSVSLMHAFTTAIVGTLAGGSVYLSQRARQHQLGLGLTAAMVLHAAFNLVVGRAEGVPVLVLAMIIGLSGTGAIILLVQRALRREGLSIGRELADVLSEGEIAAASSPQEIAAILARYRGNIAPEHADLIRQYVSLQARRGILLKSMALNQRPNFSDYLTNELNEIERRLAVLRSSMGLYTWVWLRTVLPSHDSELWHSLNRKLHDSVPILTLMSELNQRRARVPREELQARRDLLKVNPLFHDLSDDELEDLALLLNAHCYAAGEVVIAQGETDDKLYLVASGSLLWSARDSSGAETIFAAYVRGDVFGKLGLLDDEPYPTSVTCLGDVELYSLSRSDFITLIYANPHVGLEMMRELSKDVRNLTLLAMWLTQTSAGTSEYAASAQQ